MHSIIEALNSFRKNGHAGTAFFHRILIISGHPSTIQIRINKVGVRVISLSAYMYGLIPRHIGVRYFIITRFRVILA